MERPFKRRKVSLRVGQALGETNAYGLTPKWNKYNLEKETNRGRERPLPKGTPSGAFEGINLPPNPFEPPHKAPYLANEIHMVLHPRNLTQRQSLVSPMSTVIASVSQIDVQSAGVVVTNYLVPAASSAVVSNPGLPPVTLGDNLAIPSSSSPVLPFMRAASSLVAPQSTQISAAYSQALPSTFSPSSGQPASSSPSASASRVTESNDHAATGVASSTASTSTPMTLNLQRPSSQEVLSPSPSSPLPPSPEGSLSSSSVSASFFPFSADTSSQSNPTQSLSSRESQPAQNPKSLSTTRRENLSLSALLSANARPTLTGASTISTRSSSSNSKPTSTNSQSSHTGSGTSSTPSTTLTTSRVSRTSALSSRSKASLSSSSRRTSKSTSTSSRSTSRPFSFTTSSTSQRSETLALSPTITSGGTTGGAGGYGGASGTVNRASASSSTTAGAGAGAGDGSGGGGLTPATRAVVGGVVGGLAGLSIIFLLLLLLIRWRRNKARLRRPSFAPLPQSIPPGEAGQGSSMTERSSAVPLASGGFFKRLRPHSGQTAGTSDTGQSERGFQNFGGRKLESVLASRGDGYGEPGPSSATGPSAGFGSTPSVGRGQGFGHSPGPSEPETLSGSSFYRDSQGFYGGKEAETESGPSLMGSPPRSSPTYPHQPAAGLPTEGLAGPSRATSEIAVMRPGPARTPVTNQPGFIPMRNPPRPPRSTPSPRPPRGTPSPRTGPIGASPVPRPPDELGRSHPSFDGSRGSRFTEEV